MIFVTGQLGSVAAIGLISCKTPLKLSVEYSIPSPHNVVSYPPEKTRDMVQANRLISQLVTTLGAQAPSAACAFLKVGF